ncbi:40S ribosomal protein S20 [Taenia crassiceps]|uniref:40S ribosomal protein S20 n=1 Tax=Taenia crassiceps TaxID=6207 RepID=A0ABR4QQ05_9CEST
MFCERYLCLKRYATLLGSHHSDDLFVFLLKITTRKTPCGEGSKTWDRYQMRIHKRILDLYTNSETVQRLTLCDLDPMVRAEVKIEGGSA